jgi:orotidine-5'-phosphate decarboxylase
MFADQLTHKIRTSKSCLCVGFDPRLSDLPECFRASLDGGSEKGIEDTLYSFYAASLEAIATQIACIKPNIAFFEALGIGGLKALQQLCLLAKKHGVPVILDAKRGDIGSTADAYANAYFSGVTVAAIKPETIVSLLHCDALTVNPFLGFDTLQPFISACEHQGKGIFVLVKTSNPGSGDLQDQVLASGKTVSEFMAEETTKFAEKLVGKSGYSSIGAVVGATYPAQAEHIRSLMPRSYFLIPGLGSQGGDAAQAVAGFDSHKGGGIVNASRGIFSAFQSLAITAPEAIETITAKVQEFNDALNVALQKNC